MTDLGPTGSTETQSFAPARLKLRLLGRFAVDIDGEAVRAIEISGRLRRALLAYLAMQPGFAESRERLAALLWGESPDRLARQNLRQCLLDLRREFESAGTDPLKIDRETIALNSDLVAVDAREFLDLCRSNEPGDLERAASLYTGPFLDGVEVDAGAFREWVGAERARVESAAAGILERAALRHDEARNGGEATRAAERLVALDPLRESAQRLLIRLLARHKGRDAALAQADALRALLRAEFDAEEEPETAALIAEIRRSPVEPAAPVTVRRPAQPERAAGEPAAAAPSARSAHWFGIAASLAAVFGLGALGTAMLDHGPPFRADAPQVAAEPPAAANGAKRDGGDPSWASPQVQSGIAADSPALAAQGVRALVVLPFTSDAPARSPEQALADQINADLINDLSRVPGLRVISRQTARLYRGRAIDVAAVGSELGVRYVVEGDVRLAGSQARANVALTDARTRLQVWSERFERDDAERPAIRSEIVRAIARQLQVSIVAEEDERRTPERMRDPAVEDLLAKGWGAIQGSARGSMVTSGAEGYFEQVLARQPDHVSALVGSAPITAAWSAIFSSPTLSRICGAPRKC